MRPLCGTRLARSGGMSEQTLGEAPTHMAVFARSGDRASARRGFPLKVVLAPLVVVLMALGFAAAADAAFAQRALPGVSVGGIAIGTLDKAALPLGLDNAVAVPWAAPTVTLCDVTGKERATTATLGVTPVPDA